MTEPKHLILLLNKISLFLNLTAHPLTVVICLWLALIKLLVLIEAQDDEETDMTEDSELVSDIEL